MTVEELIAELKKFDPKLRVFIEFKDADDGWVTAPAIRIYPETPDVVVITEEEG